MLVAEHAILGRRKPADWPLWGRVIGTIVTFNLVCLAWIFFRSPDLIHAADFLSGLGRIDDSRITATPFVLTLLVGGLAAQFLPRDRVAMLERLVLRAPFPVQGALVGAAIVGIASLGPAGVAPFIYFQF
jgi:hypothetical protein